MVLTRGSEEEYEAYFDLAEMSACRPCTFRYWCAGDCRAEALAVTGRAEAPSPYCTALRSIIPEMFWIIADGGERLAPNPGAVMPWT